MNPNEDGVVSQWPTLNGYTITEQLYGNAHTVIYRALFSEKDRPERNNPQQETIPATHAPHSVIIKVLQQSHPSFQDLVKFRHQYAITKDLPIPGIIRPISLDPWQNGYALIMEDFGGMSLRQYVKKHSLSLIDVLVIGVQIADVLHELAAHQLVHKDIKPANILIHPQSKQVKLTDFSISSLLPKETQGIQHPRGLEGTLAYLAPEQTGRMNRGIDYRADFYALGVTLYELLTKELPFQATDPLELVHAHIAQAPVSPSQRRADIPSMVSAIVLKLMAKNAEDRYQSALGLKHDLETCLHSLKDNGSIEDFVIGSRDRCDRFTLPEKLYGRSTEVSTLLDAFARAANPPLEQNSTEKHNSTDPKTTSEIVLVAGHSGIGKTAVIQEIHKPITRQHGYFIQGKFDQFNRETPFSAFVAAFRNLIEQILCEPDTALARWKKQLLAAVGGEAQLIVDMIPELTAILGSQQSSTETKPKQPDTELSGAEAQTRFHRVFVQFVQVFAQPSHPLVIFLDDLQWADAASLQLIQVLVADNLAPHLLMLGAYRDNEVSPAHPLMMTLRELEKKDTTVHTLTLAPLPLAEVNRLIADTLHTSLTASKPLAQLIYQKTQGNPFFTTQLLKGLNEEGHITYQAGADHHTTLNPNQATTGQWTCDLSQVRQLTTTHDVVSFVVSRLKKLPEATQSAIKLAACLGNRFELHTLAIVLQSSPKTVATQLWTAMQ